MGVSIYYTASRLEPLTPAEQLSIEAAVAAHPLSGLLNECGVPDVVFDGEDFCMYPTVEPGVVFEGATKLPLCSEEAMWVAVQHWCRLLSEVRRAVSGATWRVHVDDHALVWVEELQAFDPAA